MENKLTSLTPFEMVIPVEQEYIDQLNHVGNLIYVKWIQEAAINHWMACADTHLTETIAFVIARHEIVYKYSAKLGDTVVVKTWVGKTRKHLFERYTTIYRQSDSRVFVEALSLWCPIDIKTLRPMRPTPELLSKWSVS